MNENENEPFEKVLTNLSSLLESNPENVLINDKIYEQKLIGASESLFASISESCNDVIEKWGNVVINSNDSLYCETGNDAEMIWEQVDILNTDVMKVLNKGIKKLTRSISNDDYGVRLLDWKEEDDDSCGEEPVNENSSSEDDDSCGEEPVNENSSSEDEEIQMNRIKERMDRAMVDGSEDESRADIIDDNSDDSYEKEGYDVELDKAALELNDGFFSLKGMEDFADEEEGFHDTTMKTGRSKESIDLLHSIYDNPGDDDQDVIHMTSADFFGEPNKRFLKKGNIRSKFPKESLNEKLPESRKESIKGEPSISERKTIAGKKAHRDHKKNIQNQTSILERELLAEKPWQMVGEVKATSRPQDSLLSATPQFEIVGKIAPEITIEHTENIEDMIKKRIFDENWDDITPRELPTIYNKKTSSSEVPLLSQEKSKLSLGDLYEREYLKKAQNYNVEVEEQKTKTDIAKDEMRTLFSELCSRLDALSNYHFTPRPVQLKNENEEELEFKHVTPAPAIVLEEIIPTFVSKDRRVAPEEVYEKKIGRDGVLKGVTEITQNERKQKRLANKAKRRNAKKIKLADQKLLAKVSPSLGLNNPYEKQKLQQDLNKFQAHGKITLGITNQKDSSSSATFFKRLEQEKHSQTDHHKKNAYLDDPASKKKLNVLKL